MDAEYIGLVKVIQQGGLTAFLIVLAYFLGRLGWKMYTDNQKLRDETDVRIDKIRSGYETKLERKNEDLASLLEKVLITMNDNEKILQMTVLNSDKEMMSSFERNTGEVLKAIEKMHNTIRDNKNG